MVVQVLFWLMLMPAGALPSAAQQPAYTNTHSPHGNLSIPCQNCHSAIAWKPIRAIPEFDHNKTRYPLRGMHQNVACMQCHTKPVFTNVGSKCADCHADIHRRQFGAQCEQCHTVKGWDVSIRSVQNHENRFPLLGAHSMVDCQSCHKGAATGQFMGLSTQCYSCHAQIYQTASNPNHVAGRFSTTCERCHGFDSWSNARFDHSATGFALTGAHATLQCSQCHINNNYNLTSANTACVSCHQNDYNTAVSPVNHIQLGLPNTCQSCHDTVSWLDAKFNHSATGFPLTGAHAALQCSQCHINNNYNLTSANTACVSCHQNDYNTAVSPVNHIQAGFPTACDTCHDTVNWMDGKFNHSTTGWTLTGAHTTLQCTQCHINSNYKLTSTACVTCHQNDYTTALSPVNHIQLGFPTTCEMCHDTVAWVDGKFNHNNTPFPLTGAHTTVPCASCHVNNNYSTVPTDCYSCHKTDYQGTTNPNHIAAGFPTTCQTCHTTTSWAGATFNHTWFPMTHGNAQGVCSTCHTNPSNYLVFQCTNCHTQATTTQQHQGVRNFVWNSINCYQCHPTGQGGG